MALSPRLGQGALQDESDVRNTLRANVAEKLADVWLAAHLGRETSRCKENKVSSFYKTQPPLNQSQLRFAGKVVTNLGSFPLLNANTVKSLNEVVQHLCLFARFNGEAITGWVTGHPPSTCTKTTRWEAKQGWRHVILHIKSNITTYVFLINPRSRALQETKYCISVALQCLRSGPLKMKNMTIFRAACFWADITMLPTKKKNTNCC